MDGEAQQLFARLSPRKGFTGCGLRLEGASDRGRRQPMIKQSGTFVPSMLLVAALSYLLASHVRVEAQEPVNRKSSAKTREVLRWLYEAPNRPDKRVISGQTLHVFGTGAFYTDDGGKHWNGSLNPNRYNRIQEIHDRFGYWVGTQDEETP